MSESIRNKSGCRDLGASPAAILREPEVEKYFLAVLRTDLSPQDTYNRLVRFFELRGALSAALTQRADEFPADDPQQAEQLLAAAGQEAGVWQPQEILEWTRETIARGLRRLWASRHRDGGWGYLPEISSTWATVFAVLALRRSLELELAPPDAATLVAMGTGWLIDHRDDWSVEHVPDHDKRSIYELSAVLRCLLETDSDADPDTGHLIRVCLERLAKAQNVDGGWDAAVWGAAPLGPTGIWSEVGATSFAVQALIAARQPAPAFFSAPIRLGLGALARSQNQDGSWGIMLHHEGLAHAYGSLTKTCDAVKGLLAGRQAGFDDAGHGERIDRAVEWLVEHEQPIFTRTMSIAGWGWAGSEHSALENTCHTLETLLTADHVRLPLLTSNAAWLMHNQHRQPGSVEDGKWINDDTGRIVLALVEFYCAIRKSPLFAPLITPAPAADAAP